MSRWLFLLVVAVAAPAFADHAGLARARGAIDDNKFEEARDHLRATLRSGELGPEDLAQAYLLEGMVELVLGDAADVSFRHAVLLSRSIELPEGSAPKFGAALTKARAFIDKNGALLVAIARDADLVIVTIENDPISIVKSIAGQGADDKTLVVPAARKVTLAVTGTTVTLRDVWGNTVREIAVPDVPAVVREHVVTRPESVAWYRRPLVWGVATATLAVAGTAAYVLAASAKSDLDDIIANSEAHTFDEAESARQSWRTQVHFADGLFIAAGAFAVVTVVAVINQPSGAIVTPANGGAQVGYLTRF